MSPSRLFILRPVATSLFMLAILLAGAIGYRVLPLSALLLMIAVRAENDYLAVAALSGCFGCAQMTEAPFWAAAFWVARERASGATGVLNMGGNLGGMVGTPIVAWLTQGHNWPAALATGVGFALASAALWLLVDVERRPLVAP